MKTRTIITALVFLALLSISCNILTNTGVKLITPSNVIISENRDVSGFNAIEFSTMGKINLMQGDKESLNISGPDNLVPEIIAEVRNGTLMIKTKENINVAALGSNNPLTFTIVVKDLLSLSVSGVGDVQMETLSTPSLDINMSGAGKVLSNQLATQNLNINISGVGGLEITGEAPQTTIDISGAGGVDAPDLKAQTAKITISGLGNVIIWVTDQLTGNISGGGSVSYYGNPQVNTTSSGIGRYKSLGEK
jgi:hypothetical protein